VSAGVSAAPTGQVSGKFAIGDLCENLARNLKYGIKSGMCSHKYILLLPVAVKCYQGAAVFK
jgi:hypothetical protein